MRTLLLTLATLLFQNSITLAEIAREDVSYEANGTQLKGAIYYDSSTEKKRPGVLVVHEWWGLNDYVHRRAKMLAKLGYVAFAIDMYGDGKTAGHPKDAKNFSMAVKKDPKGARLRFDKALDILKAHTKVEQDKLAAVGYCFGGGMVLQMARAGVDLEGVVSFHGSLATDTPAEKDKVKAKILVLHGAADAFIPESHVKEFKEEMKTAGVSLIFESYPGVKHSFTSKEADEFAKKFDLAVGYDEGADKASWIAMKKFLNEIFS